MTQQWTLIAELFETALDVEPARRRRYLAKACRDECVRAEVLALLDEHENLGDSIVSPSLDGAIGSLERAASLPTVNLLAAKEPDPLIGRVLDGRYVLKEFLGAGGSSRVYAATDRQLPDKRWVIKILTGIHRDQRAYRTQFDREVKALVHLDGCDGIVAISATGELAEGWPYLVFSPVVGKSLRDAIQGEPMDFPLATQLIRQIGRALATAHAAGVYHLDLKPDNVILKSGSDGELRAWLIDFGTATIESPEGDGRTTLTQNAGTTGYMAPERARGARPGSKMDVYAFGIIAFEMLIGRLPTPEEFEQLEALRTSRKAAALQNSLSRRTQRAIARAVAYDPAHRSEDAAPFASEVCESLTQLPSVRLHRGQTGGGTIREAGAALWEAVRSAGVLALAGLVLVAAVVTGIGIGARYGPPSAPSDTSSHVAVGTLSQVDDLRDAYRAGVVAMKANIALQFVLVAVAFPLAARADRFIRLPALGLAVPSAWVFLPMGFFLVYLWLEFGFKLDDLIKWRAQAWHLLAALGATDRASEFNDGGFLDGWFMCFRPLEHSIRTGFVAGSAIFLSCVYCPLFALNHACSVTLPLIASKRLARSIRPGLVRAGATWAVPLTITALIALSHLQFRFGGRNPNWLQGVEVTFALVSTYGLCRRARRKLRAEGLD
jgi:tRNA A-37 threonylcarbamoyl transferase component Bud32